MSFHSKEKFISVIKQIRRFPIAVILFISLPLTNIPTLIKSLVSSLEESQVLKSKQMARYLLHTLCHRY